MKRRLEIFAMLLVVIAALFLFLSGALQAQTVPAPPTASPGAGSYSGPQTVTLSTATAGANIYYTLDGSTPDYTSTLYVAGSPITVTPPETVKAIAGMVYGTTYKPGTGTVYETQSTAGWKKPDCQSPGTANCTSDNPGGAGIPSLISNPTGSPGGSGYSGTGLITCPAGSGQNPTPSSKCMSFSQTPATSAQTNTLYPRTGGFSSGDAVPTWILTQGMAFYPTSNSTNVSAYEWDSQIFAPVQNLNYQYGGQCTKCDQAGNAQWDIGGTSNTPWIATGITYTLTKGTWHSVVFLYRNITSELTSKPCKSNQGSTKGESFPCLYYMKAIFDGTDYNEQTGTITLANGSSGGTFSPCPSRPAGSGTGCTITADTLESGFGANLTTQHQLDTLQSGTKTSIESVFDKESVTSLYDPTAVQTFVYTATGPPPPTPTLLSSYLTAPGSVTTLTVGQTLQFSVFCHYNSGPDQNCTVADIYGDAATSFTSSNTAVATIEGISHPSPGLASAVAAGTVNITAAVNHTVVTPNYGLTINTAAVTLTGVSLATTGGVTGLFVSSTNQLLATCAYSDSSTTNCTSTDSHGNKANTYVSTLPGHATVGSATGLITGVAPGSTTFTAHAGSFTSTAIPLTVLAVPAGVYTLTFSGPVSWSGSVSF